MLKNLSDAVQGALTVSTKVADVALQLGKSSTKVADVAVQLGKSISQAPDWTHWKKIAESIAKVTGTTAKAVTDGAEPTVNLDGSNMSVVMSLASNIVTARVYLKDRLTASPQLQAAFAEATESMAKLKSLPDDAVEAAREQMRDLAKKLEVVRKMLTDAPQSVGDFIAAQITNAIIRMVISALLHAAAGAVIRHMSVGVLLLAVPELLLLALL